MLEERILALEAKVRDLERVPEVLRYHQKLKDDHNAAPAAAAAVAAASAAHAPKPEPDQHSIRVQIPDPHPTEHTANPTKPLEETSTSP